MSVSLINSNAVGIPLADSSVHCVVTSPPYWGLRDYGLPGRVWGGEVGCEHVWEDNTFVRNNDQTVGPKQRTNVGAIGRDEPVRNAFCQRCGAWRGCLGLEPTPEMYVGHMVDIFREVKRVLRDDGTAWCNLGDSYSQGGGKQVIQTKNASHGLEGMRARTPNMPAKQLLGIPWRVAFALQADGWWLRSDIIWHKPNPMPESVTDRPTKAHEYMFLLSKGKQYYYDADAVREGWADNRMGASGAKSLPYSIGSGRHDTLGNDNKKGLGIAPVTTGRNRRTVWAISAKPYSAHFATYPPALVEPCIKAGCPPGGIVLDPFVGSGTTLVVARQLGRSGIGLDLSFDYLAQARKRLGLDKLAAWAGDGESANETSLEGLPLFQGM